MQFISSFVTRMRAFIARNTNKYTITAAVVIVVFLGFGFIKGMLGATPADVDKAVARQVQVAPAGLVSELESVLETTGEVKSQAEGDLRAQRAGVITYVGAKVGQYVRAGTIIASIENASELASVAQAEAGVAQAEASLHKVTGGTRSEQLAVLAAQTASAQQALNESQASARNTLLSAYVATNANFSGGVDPMFKNADGANPELKFTSSNSSETLAAEHDRFLLQVVIDRHVQASGKVKTLDAAGLLAEIDLVETDLLQMKELLDNLVTSLDGAVADAAVSETTIATYQTKAAAARSSVLATLSTISTTRGALNASKNALTVAQENESQGVTGAQQEDIEVSEAQVEAARASYAQAVAQLENTRVRAPVSGTVTILNVDKGDFVTSFQDIGIIANEGSLEVQTFISSNAVTRLAVGGSALIGGKYEGVITSIAPGIDPVKRQVEVRVALVSKDATLPHGARVGVEFLNVQTEDVQTEGPLMIPVAALKLIGDKAFVFTVTADNTLVAQEVTLGSVVQASIEITSGIDRDTVIVLDARGLNEGDSVTVSN